jgi:hypothetical protein
LIDRLLDPRVKGMAKQKFDTGDLFLVKLADSTYSVGQILRVTKEVMNSVICAFFYIRVESATESIETLSESRLLTVQFVTAELLRNGTWKVIGNVPPVVDYEKYVHYQELLRKKFIGAEILGAGILVHFMNACFGLRTWDDHGWGTDNFFDKLLVSPDRRPGTIRRPTPP